jgi:hypothetical protein
LEGGTGRFARGVLNGSGQAHPIKSVVHLQSGVAALQQMTREFFEWVTVKGQNSGAIGDKVRLADFVDVTLTSEVPTPLVLQARHRAGGPTTSIALKVLPDSPTIVTFTNLCSRPFEPIDQEFAALYETLEKPTLTRDRLIPRAVSPRLGGDFDCTKSAYISFRIA